MDEDTQTTGKPYRLEEQGFALDRPYNGHLPGSYLSHYGSNKLDSNANEDHLLGLTWPMSLLQICGLVALR